MKGDINIFTILIIASAFTFIFRLDGLLQKIETVSSISSAIAVEKVDEAPPPIEIKQEPLAGENFKSPYGNKTPRLYQSRFTDTEIKILQSLSQRRKSLDKREQQIATKEAFLKVAEEEVNKKIAELNKLKSKIEQLLGKQDKLQEARIRSLVKIYESMKPKDAAKIFNTLDMEVLLDVIGRMSERKTAPILASMQPDRAREVTIKLAKQKHLPATSPKYGN